MCIVEFANNREIKDILGQVMRLTSFGGYTYNRPECSKVATKGLRGKAVTDSGGKAAPDS